jgi:hypothetical protein
MSPIGKKALLLLVRHGETDDNKNLGARAWGRLLGLVRSAS